MKNTFYYGRKKRPARLDVKTLRWIASWLRDLQYPTAYSYQTPRPKDIARRVGQIASAEEKRQRARRSSI